jgi:hypothetical protein
MTQELTDLEIEKEIARIEKDVYAGNMPADNKRAMRVVLREESLEDEFWQKADAREDSHSAVGDMFNMEAYHMREVNS